MVVPNRGGDRSPHPARPLGSLDWLKDADAEIFGEHGLDLVE